MQTERFPRRPVVISLIVPVLGLVIVGAICAGILGNWKSQNDRATSVVEGRGSGVGEFDSDDTVRFDVYWEDADGESHEAQYRVPDGSRLDDRPFLVRYDPADPEALVFPAGPDAGLVIPPTPPWWVLFFLLPFVILVGGIVLGWRSRIGAAREAAATTTGERYRVVPFTLEGTQIGFGGPNVIDVGLGTMLLPATEPFDEEAFPPGRPLARPAGALWQRTMWSPGFAGLTPGAEVTVHRSEGKGGRAVLITDRGTVWPAGPLLDKDFPRRVPIKVAYRSAVNRKVSPGKAYLVAPLFGLCAAPAALRTPAALLLLPYAVLLGYSLGILAWSWRGGIPER